MAFLKHPIWLAGFRPFFTLTFISGALLPLLWGALFAGLFTLPASAPSSVVWHAHEMFYGFGWALMGGFLLTASKNWVGVRGIHGGLLAFATLLWLIERVTLLWSGAMPEVVRLVAVNAFIVFTGGYVAWTLVRYRRTDSFPDNWVFLVALTLFVIAKNLMLSPTTYVQGTAMTLGLFRVAFVVMFERTITQFMRNAAGVTLVRHAWLDWPIKLLTLLLVAQAWLPTQLAAALLATVALLMLVRFFLWSPIEGLRRFGIAVMYVGYAGLVAHFATEALRLTGTWVPLGAVSMHVFSFLVMGVIVPGMMIRICQGHTGRRIVFSVSDRVAYGFIATGAFFRLVATQAWPERYLLWIAVSAVLWALCFALVGIRLTPFLWRPRIDGREH